MHARMTRLSRSGISAGGLALALTLSACTSTNPCSSGTLLVSVTLDATTAQANKLVVVAGVEGTGSTAPADLEHTPGIAAGTVEIDFPHGYPAGQTVAVTITAYDGTTPLGSGHGTAKLTGSCGTTEITVNRRHAGRGHRLALRRKRRWHRRPYWAPAARWGERAAPRAPAERPAAEAPSAREGPPRPVARAPADAARAAPSARRRHAGTGGAITGAGGAITGTGGAGPARAAPSGTGGAGAGTGGAACPVISDFATWPSGKGPLDIGKLAVERLQGPHRATPTAAPATPGVRLVRRAAVHQAHRRHANNTSLITRLRALRDGRERPSTTRPTATRRLPRVRRSAARDLHAERRHPLQDAGPGARGRAVDEHRRRTGSPRTPATGPTTCS